MRLSLLLPALGWLSTALADSGGTQNDEHWPGHHPHFNRSSLSGRPSQWGPFSGGWPHKPTDTTLTTSVVADVSNKQTASQVPSEAHSDPAIDTTCTDETTVPVTSSSTTCTDEISTSALMTATSSSASTTEMPSSSVVSSTIVDPSSLVASSVSSESSNSWSLFNPVFTDTAASSRQPAPSITAPSTTAQTSSSAASSTRSKKSKSLSLFNVHFTDDVPSSGQSAPTRTSAASSSGSTSISVLNPTATDVLVSSGVVVVPPSEASTQTTVLKGSITLSAGDFTTTATKKDAASSSLPAALSACDWHLAAATAASQNSGVISQLPDGQVVAPPKETDDIKGSVNMDVDGQVFLNRTDLEWNSFSIDSTGQLYAGKARNCIITAEGQFQCDNRGEFSRVFSLCNGLLSVNGSIDFWACPAGDGKGGYKLFTQDRNSCKKLSLTADNSDKGANACSFANDHGLNNCSGAQATGTETAAAGGPTSAPAGQTSAAPASAGWTTTTIGPDTLEFGGGSVVKTGSLGFTATAWGPEVILGGGQTLRPISGGAVIGGTTVLFTGNAPAASAPASGSGVQPFQGASVPVSGGPTSGGSGPASSNPPDSSTPTSTGLGAILVTGMETFTITQGQPYIVISSPSTSTYWFGSIGSFNGMPLDDKWSMVPLPPAAQASQTGGPSPSGSAPESSGAPQSSTNQSGAPQTSVPASGSAAPSSGPGSDAAPAPVSSAPASTGLGAILVTGSETFTITQGQPSIMIGGTSPYWFGSTGMLNGSPLVWSTVTFQGSPAPSSGLPLSVGSSPSSDLPSPPSSSAPASTFFGAVLTSGTDTVTITSGQPFATFGGVPVTFGSSGLFNNQPLAWVPITGHADAQPSSGLSLPFGQGPPSSSPLPTGIPEGFPTDGSDLPDSAFSTCEVNDANPNTVTCGSLTLCVGCPPVTVSGIPLSWVPDFGIVVGGSTTAHAANGTVVPIFTPLTSGQTEYTYGIDKICIGCPPITWNSHEISLGSSGIIVDRTKTIRAEDQTTESPNPPPPPPHIKIPPLIRIKPKPKPCICILFVCACLPKIPDPPCICVPGLSCPCHDGSDSKQTGGGGSKSTPAPANPTTEGPSSTGSSSSSSCTEVTATHTVTSSMCTVWTSSGTGTTTCPYTTFLTTETACTVTGKNSATVSTTTSGPSCPWITLSPDDDQGSTGNSSESAGSSSATGSSGSLAPTSGTATGPPSTTSSASLGHEIVLLRHIVGDISDFNTTYKVKNDKVSKDDFVWFLDNYDLNWKANNLPVGGQPTCIYPENYQQMSWMPNSAHLVFPIGKQPVNISTTEQCMYNSSTWETLSQSHDDINSGEAGFFECPSFGEGKRAVCKKFAGNFLSECTTCKDNDGQWCKVHFCNFPDLPDLPVPTFQPTAASSSTESQPSETSEPSSTASPTGNPQWKHYSVVILRQKYTGQDASCYNDSPAPGVTHEVCYDNPFTGLFVTTTDGIHNIDHDATAKVDTCNMITDRHDDWKEYLNYTAITAHVYPDKDSTMKWFDIDCVIAGDPNGKKLPSMSCKRDSDGSVIKAQCDPITEDWKECNVSHADNAHYDHKAQPKGNPSFQRIALCWFDDDRSTGQPTLSKAAPSSTAAPQPSPTSDFAEHQVMILRHTDCDTANIEGPCKDDWQYFYLNTSTVGDTCSYANKAATLQVNWTTNPDHHFYASTIPLKIGDETCTYNSTKWEAEPNGDFSGDAGFIRCESFGDAWSATTGAKPGGKNVWCDRLDWAKDGQCSQCGDDGTYCKSALCKWPSN